MVAITSTTVRAPRMVYCPSSDDACHFEKTSASSGRSLGILPTEFPPQLISKSVWKGRDIENQSKEWTIELTEHDVESVSKALLHFECKLDTSKA